MAEDKNPERDPVYYYSREHRLNRASPAVRALNDGKPIKPSLKRTLFGSRGNIMVFASIVAICFMLNMVSRISNRDSGVKLGGNTVALTILREEGIAVLTIIKNVPKGGEAYTGEVDIAVSPVMPKSKAEEIPVFSHRIFFNPVDAETFSVALPFEKNDFVALLSTGDERKSIKLKAREIKRN